MMDFTETFGHLDPDTAACIREYGHQCARNEMRRAVKIVTDMGDTAEAEGGKDACNDYRYAASVIEDTWEKMTGEDEEARRKVIARAEMLKCCADVCVDCAQGKEPKKVCSESVGDFWYHDLGRCKATNIRSRWED
jgi:hypothetical protein